MAGVAAGRTTRERAREGCERERGRLEERAKNCKAM